MFSLARDIRVWWDNTSIDLLYVQTSNQEKITNPVESANTSITASSPVRRPLTRSQTGTVTKRRRPDEAPLHEVRQRSTRTPKKLKAAFDKGADPSSTTTSEEDMVAIPMPRQISAPKGGDMPEPSKALTAGTPIVQSSPKLRANLPIPVPNLTKKSRGRRVPTKHGSDVGNSVNPKDATRIYVCKVENCGKCFHRGEHLKRHIRSIHTHEKRESIRHAFSTFTVTLNTRSICTQPSSVHTHRVTSTLIDTTISFNT